jgi:WD40 repeat protein
VARLDEPEVAIFRCADACEKTSIIASYATAVAFDSKRSLAAVGLGDGSVKIFGPGSDLFEVEPRGEASASIVALAWSSDGRHLAIGTTGGQVIIADGHGKREAVAATVGSVSSIARDPQSARLATACETSVICVWGLLQDSGKPAELRLLAYLAGHTQGVGALAWAPNGRMLASAGDDTVRIWTVDHPDRASFGLDAGAAVALTDLDVASNRKWLAAGDDQGGARVWSLPSLALQPLLRGVRGTEKSPGLVATISPCRRR